MVSLLAQSAIDRGLELWSGQSAIDCGLELWSGQSAIYCGLELWSGQSAIYCGLELWSGQIKDCTIGIYCISTKHTVLMSKNKDWSTRYWDNVSDWSDMSTHWLSTSTIKIQLSVLV